jgi:hypothetical protein
MHAFIQAEDILSICWGFCDFINNNNSTVIKLGLCTENVLCQVWAKYYIVKVFIVECNIDIKLKNHSFTDIFLYELFLILMWKTHSAYIAITAALVRFISVDNII